jgi:L-lactate dehydrogenase complex protein LldE
VSAVTLFAPCYLGVLRPGDTGHARRVLEALGDEVEVLSGRCCGQPAFNSGFRDEALSVGRELLRAGHHRETVVVPSGSCTSMIHHYLPSLFAEERRKQAQAAGRRFVELAEYVASHPNLDALQLRLEGTVAYHDSCHCRRELRLTGTVVALLGRIDGLEVRRLPNEDECCGFGGTFSVKMREVSAVMVQHKLNDIMATGASVAVSTDLSCLVNLEAGARGLGRPLETWSLAELLSRSLP